MGSSYSTDLVILSVVVACIASYAALDLAGHLARRGASWRWFAGAATAMGIGIWSMHFIGMLAYQLPVAVAYDLWTVVLSLLIAMAGSAIGLRVAGQERPTLRAGALAGPAMGFAIAGMHYTGMAAMRLPASQHYATMPVLLSVLVAIVASYAAIALFVRFRFERSRRGFWLKLLSAVVMGHAVAGMHYTGMWAVHFRHGTTRPGGMILPPYHIAIALALATTAILVLVLVAAVVDRWILTQGQIRRSEERFRAMVDALRDHAVFTLDAQGHIDSWNLGAERLSGHKADDVLGHHLRELYRPESRHEADRDLALALQFGRHESQSLRLTSAGEERVVFATTTPMFDTDGRLLGYARIVRDVTAKARAEEELRRSEEQLRQAQKMEAVGLLAGGVAHDFNNMLMAIRGYAELLQVDARPDSDAHDALSEITAAADRAAELTRQLLAFSRKQLLQPTIVNPNEVVVEMERMLQRLLVGNVQLVTELSEDVGHITVDPAQLQQVLLNLALNARDALPRGGTVKIRTANTQLTDAFCRTHPGARAGECVLLSVSDDGEGIPPEIQQHVFEPFFTTKALGTGTGLGLSTVYGIVKQSGGYVWLESAVGKGTTFSICFPRTTEALSERVSRPSGSVQRSTHETVLLVDDEHVVRRMLARMLTRGGYLVIEADGGEAALAALAQHSGTIDLVVTDIMMPGMNGRELARRVEAVCPGTRVLFTSGYASDEVIERGLLEPTNAFIQKPFTAAAFVDKVREVLATRRAKPIAAAGALAPSAG